MAESSFAEQMEADQERRRAGLEKLDFSGPHPTIGGSMGLGATEFAVCLVCGAAVMLGDPMEAPAELAEHLPDDAPRVTERGVYLHAKWHHEATR